MWGSAFAYIDVRDLWVFLWTNLVPRETFRWLMCKVSESINNCWSSVDNKQQMWNKWMILSVKRTVWQWVPNRRAGFVVIPGQKHTISTWKASENLPWSVVVSSECFLWNLICPLVTEHSQFHWHIDWRSPYWEYRSLPTIWSAVAYTLATADLQVCQQWPSKCVLILKSFFYQIWKYL